MLHRRSLISSKLMSIPEYIPNRKSVVFDGVDEVASAAHVAAHMPTNQLTLSCWFKAPVDPIASYAPWVGKIDDINWESGYGLYYTTDFAGDDVNFFVNKWDTDVVQIPWNQDTDWHHIAGVANGTNVIVWLDGSKVVGPVYSKPITPATGTFKFMDGYAPYISSGNLDEVSFWNVGLSDSDVLIIYNDGTPMSLDSHPRFSNLVSWWRCGDGDSYPILKDVIGGYNATMVNMGPGNIVEDVP